MLTFSVHNATGSLCAAFNPYPQPQQLQLPFPPAGRYTSCCYCLIYRSCHCPLPVGELVPQLLPPDLCMSVHGGTATAATLLLLLQPAAP